MRTIDGAERRRVLSEAVWRIIRRDGFDAASVRAVAKETGLSTGSVRHFFDTQNGLHIFAMEELIRVVSERASFAARTGLRSTDMTLARDDDENPSGRRRVTAALLELLPVTEETTDLYRAHLQFVIRSSVEPSLAPVAKRSFDELQAFYRQLLQLLIESGDAAPRLDLDATTDELAALMDGIVVRRIATPHLLTEAGAAALVDRFLDRLRSEVHG